MADSSDPSRDAEWYRTRWEELTDLLPTSSPEEVIERVRDLQIHVLDENADALTDLGLPDSGEAKRVLTQIFERLQALRRDNQSLRALQAAVDADTPEEAQNEIESLRARIESLEQEQQALASAGFENPEHAAQAIASMQQQLEELYGEKEATERVSPEQQMDGEADTFGQLQALLAREEELQRELGVASPEAVIRMVEGLTDQLEDVYRDRDAEASTESAFQEAVSHPVDGSEKFEEELGVSEPDAVIEMVQDLTRQLDTLYTGQERLAELNLTGVDDAIAMVQSMQEQLESLYRRREKLSEHGIDGIDHAVSMIESMETQLSELYDERERLAEDGVDDAGDGSRRLEELETKLDELIEEKEVLQQKRDRLQSQLDEFEEEFGTSDPEALSNLIGSLEQQLESVYSERADQVHQQALPEESRVPNDVLEHLSTAQKDDLDALPVGIFGVDEEGTVRRVNDKVTEWPDVNVDDAKSLVGQNFFTDVAPGTNSALFRGRFDKGAERGSLDERFLYTYISKMVPPCNLAVHLYRPPDDPLCWILFEVQ